MTMNFIRVMVLLAAVTLMWSNVEAKTSSLDANDKDVYQGSLTGRQRSTYQQAGLASTYIGSAISPYTSNSGYGGYGGYRSGYISPYNKPFYPSQLLSVGYESNYGLRNPYQTYPASVYGGYNTGYGGSSYGISNGYGSGYGSSAYGPQSYLYSRPGHYGAYAHGTSY